MRSAALAAFVRERHSDGSGRLFVAVAGGEVVGFGKTHWLACDGGGVPEGWYLTGVVVDPTRRRSGIGSRLTLARLEWLAARTSAVYYVANARNEASEALHARFGFRKVRRITGAPGVTFSGGAGVLYVLDLNSDAAFPGWHSRERHDSVV